MANGADCGAWVYSLVHSRRVQDWSVKYSVDIERVSLIEKTRSGKYKLNDVFNDGGIKCQRALAFVHLGVQ